MELQELRIPLPYEEGQWKVVGFDEIEYRNDSVIGWEEFIEEKVKTETNLNYPIRISRFNFGILFQSVSTLKNTRLQCAVTIAEQNNEFYVYLEDEDVFLPDACLDLKKMKNKKVVDEILTNALKNDGLLQQLEEWKHNYKTYESFSGVRTFRRLKKFINEGCPYKKILS